MILEIFLAFLIVAGVGTPIVCYIDKWHKEMQQEGEDNQWAEEKSN